MGSKKNSLSIQESREAILGMPAQEALEAIVSHPKGGDLVKSFSAQDLYFLIHEIGLDDCLPVLSLASTRQWQYLMDVDIWKEDELDFRALATWMDRMLAADPDRLVTWLATRETDLLELWLYKNVSVKFLEHDQDPNELPKGYFTLDGALYVRLRESFSPDDKDMPDMHSLTETLLQRIASLDYEFYHKMLFEMHGTIPSETVENSFRVRNVRLGERGFLPPHESAAIYQKLDAQDLINRPEKLLNTDDMTGYTLPFLTGSFARGENRFSQSLEQIDNPAISNQIQSEFAGLCNQVIVADRNKVQSRQDLEKAVQKCSGYLNMGLDAIREKTGQAPETSVRKHALAEIFQVGFGLVLALKFKAQRWKKGAWFQNQGLPLPFWGEERLGVLGGLLLDKPLFYDNFRTGSLYRDFASVDDVQAAEKILEDIMALDSLMASMDCANPAPLAKGLNCENLILTPWANYFMGSESPYDLLDIGRVRTFFHELFDPASHGVKDPMKSNFLEWMEVQTGFTQEEIGARLGKALTALFAKLEDQYGKVDSHSLDTKYISMFLCV